MANSPDTALTAHEKDMWRTAYAAYLASTCNSATHIGPDDSIDAAMWATETLDSLTRLAHRGPEMKTRGLSERAHAYVVAVLGNVKAPARPEASSTVEDSTYFDTGSQTWGIKVVVGSESLYDYVGYESEADAERAAKRYRVMAETFVAKQQVDEVQRARSAAREREAEEARRPPPPKATVTICGERLGYARRMSEISIPSAASALDITTSEVQQLETGTPAVALPLLRRLCGMYGVTDAYLTTIAPADIASYQRAKRDARS